MRKTVLIALMLGGSLFQSWAQNIGRPKAIGFHLGTYEYKGDVGNEFFTFKDLHLAPGFSYNQYVSRSWDVNLMLHGGMLDHNDGTNAFDAKLIALEGTFRYKLANGIILKEGAKFAPYGFIGIGDALASVTDPANPGERIRRMDFNLPAGWGINFHLSDRTVLNYQSGWHYVFTDEWDGVLSQRDPKHRNDQFYHHTLGLVFNLANENDADGDGVADDLDHCPNEAGSVETNGCPGLEEEDEAMLIDIAKNIYFETGSDVLKEESKTKLDLLVAILTRYEKVNLDVEGHTDNTGAPEFNKTLSGKRAAAVVKYLTDKGINGARLTSAGYGEERPIASNDTDEGRAQNRRVELRTRF